MTDKERELALYCLRASSDYGINGATTVLTIPENPTNGDMIRAIFPNLAERDLNRFINFTLDQTTCNSVKKSWWDAPYKAESEEHE